MNFEDRLWAELDPAARRARRRPWIVVIGPAGLRAAVCVAIALIVLAAGGAVVGVLDRSAPPAKPAPRKVQTVPVGGTLGGAVAGFGSVWVVDPRHGVVRIDPRTRRITGRVDVPNPWLDARIAVAAGSVWLTPSRVTHGTASRMTRPVTLTRIDPLRGRVTARIRLAAPGGLPVMPVDLAVAADAVWVWGQAGALRVDPDTNRVTRAIRVRGDNIKAFAVDGSTVWTATELGRLERFDARTGRRLTTLPIDPVASSFPLIVVPQAVIVHEDTGAVAAVDPRTGRGLWRAAVAGGMRSAAMLDGRLWILTSSATRPVDELVALDPGSGRALARIELPDAGGSSVNVVGPELWVTDESGDVDIVHP